MDNGFDCIYGAVKKVQQYFFKEYLVQPWKRKYHAFRSWNELFTPRISNHIYTGLKHHNFAY